MEERDEKRDGEREKGQGERDRGGEETVREMGREGRER